jgi:tetratricopeptide (TPR) repeat protein/V8-like Glu-specific endopeptidase
MSRYTPAILGLAFSMVLTLGERTLALSPSEVGQVAKQITVSIKSTESEYGSGTIVQHQGNTYTVLTAAHVLKNARAAYNLTTPDGQTYQLQAATIKKFPSGVDLAVAKFTSDRSYPIAKIGDSNSVVEGNTAFVSGYPAPTAAINLSVYVFRKGDVVANSSRALEGGYALIYSANTLPGMSGGGVFNDRGELIATHGRGDISETYRPDAENPTVRFKTGNDLGIPVNTFRQLATQLAIDLGNSTPAVAAKTTSAPKAGDYILSAENKSRQSDYSGAITDLDRAIAIDPRSAESYISRAEAYVSLGKAKQSSDDANRALRLKPNAAKAYVIRATAKIGLSDLAGARADANRALQLNPELSSAYGIRGLTKVLSGEYRNVNTDFDRAIALDPTSVDAYLLRGQVRRFLGNFDGALADVNYVIERKSKLAEAYGTRALIKLSKDDKAGAKADAERSIALAPNSAESAYSILGKFAYDAGDTQKAIDYANKAIQSSSFSVSGYQVRGLANLKLGKAQLSIDDANRILKINPQDPGAYAIRGGGYALLRNKAAVLRDWRMASKLMREQNLTNSDDYRQLQQAIKLIEAN